VTSTLDRTLRSHRGSRPSTVLAFHWLKWRPWFAFSTVALLACGKASRCTERFGTVETTPGPTTTRSDAPPEFRDAPTATAALRSILAGYAIPFDPEELSRQCKVDDTGASIDDVEDVANTYGLIAEQQLFAPADLCAPAGVTLPAILIVRREGGALELVNVWRRRRDEVQVMDPWSGVSWVKCATLQERAYVHEMVIDGKTHRGIVAVIIQGLSRKPSPGAGSAVQHEDGT
jgi:hypothetical protein